MLPAEELSWRFSRSSGPGGQGVNTADSRVELSWEPSSSRALDEALRERVLERLEGRLVDGVLTVSAAQHRQQVRNRAAARDRLAALVAEAAAPPSAARRATRISRGAQRRRTESKQARSSTKALRRRPEW